MGRFRGSITKLSRREGINLAETEKVQKYLDKRPYAPGQIDAESHGAEARRIDGMAGPAGKSMNTSSGPGSAVPTPMPNSANPVGPFAEESKTLPSRAVAPV